MALNKISVLIAVTALIALGAAPARAQAPNLPPGAQSGSHGNVPPVNPNAGQGSGESDSTLEIAPQPGAIPREPGVDVAPGGRAYVSGEESASVQPGYRPNSENDNGGGNQRPGRRPYLGVTVRYTTECYAGMEEHGLEVVTIDPNSPAQRAGLQGRTGPTAVGATGLTAGTLLGPLSMLVNPLLVRSGSLGQGGDLIVAVDDERIRSEDDLNEAMARIKPGDTMYLTVIRPTGNGNHKTMKIAVHVGTVGQPVANASTPPYSPSGSGAAP